MKKFLSLNRSHLFILLFICIILGGGSKKMLLWFMSESVLPMSSSRSCICLASHLVFNPLGANFFLCMELKNDLAVVQSLSHVHLFVTPWAAAFQVSLSNSWLMSINPVMPSNYLILCHPLVLLPSIFPSIRVFSNESALHIKWPKYWSFSISISNEYSGLISFRINWLDLLAVQGTLKSLLQHYSSK